MKEDDNKSVDEVLINVQDGNGGNGCMAYRREACVPMGGPFGGNGGKGADIIFKADEGLKTLIDLRYQKKINGNNGEKVALGKSKIIKDMTKADFVASLKGYQDGTYGGAQKALMVGQVKGMDEATMNAIADLIIK